MSGVNKVIVLGRLGKDPEVKNFDNGSKLANFTMATSEKWKDKTSGETKEVTDWHNIRVSGPLVDVVQKYVRKGDMLYVEGKMRTRSWEKDGITRYTTEVVVDSLSLLSNKRQEGASQAPSYQAPAQQQAQSAPSSAWNDGPTDDLPF
ncbi:MAG: single-stranded DNA-binding protein [Flavobacteriales bacterium]|jgi:single-strand DNA-binding protein